MGVIAAACCCEGYDDDGPPDTNWLDCCPTGSNTLTIDLAATCEQTWNHGLAYRRSCCPAADCDGECLGSLWNQSNTWRTTQAINGRVQFDLTSSKLNATLISGSSSVSANGTCNWSCGNSCAFQSCPCSNSITYTGDGAVMTPLLSASIESVSDTTQPRNYPCNGETVYPGDCYVTVVLASQLEYDIRTNENFSCFGGQQIGGGDYIARKYNQVGVSYRIFEREGECEVAEIPFRTSMAWGPDTGDPGFNGAQGYIDVEFGNKYGTAIGAQEDFQSSGSPCIGYGWPNASFDVDYDESFSSEDEQSFGCSNPDVNTYTELDVSGSYSTTLTYVSEAVLS